MNRYDLTPEAKWIATVQAVTYHVAVGCFVAWIFVYLFRVAPVEEVRSIQIGAAIFGALWLYGTNTRIEEQLANLVRPSA